VKLAWIALAWIAYGAIHSLLASLTIKKAIARRWPNAMPAYRLAFNIFAVVALIPVLWLVYSVGGAWLWRWTGVWAWLGNGLALAAIAGVMISPVGYDMAEFLGLRQIRQRDRSTWDREGFRISALHRHVRHPWYCLNLILVWTRDMNGPLLISAIAITLYFVIGSMLEENKLVAMHGDAYREYRRRVPGLIPLPWKHLSAIEAAALVQRARHG
jgi:protein-S-isoprenylcysteine O-methyltransferase Ste14